MTGMTETSGRRGVNWRVIGWGGAAALLATPFIAMRFTSEVDWGPVDFITMGVIFGLVGLTIELAVRASSHWAYRAGAGFAVLASFFLIWVNLAVGMIGDEDNAYNLLFGGVLVIAIAGAIAVRARPQGLARVMVVAGLSQAGIGLAGLSTDPLGGTLSAGMGGIWLISAWLFGKAGRAGA